MHICIAPSFFLMMSTGCAYSEVDGITIPWIVTNLTMYGTPLTRAVTFGIGKGMKSDKLDHLARFHA